MKLIIDISQMVYDDVRDNILFAKEINSDIKWEIIGAIVNGISLYRVREEMIDALIQTPYDSDDIMRNCGVGECIHIIDKYIGDNQNDNN